MKKILACMLILALTCTLFIGCTKKPGSKEEEGNKKTDDNWQTYQEKSGKDEPVTVTWWIMPGIEAPGKEYYSEMKGLKEIQKITGVNIDFNVANNYDVYLPMMAAENYPHIISATNMMTYPGRLSAMYKDGVSIKLNDMMEEWMPTFSKLVKDNPDIGRDLRLEGGVYTFLSAIYDTENKLDRGVSSQMGIAVRQDWLDEVNKEVPTNIDEWFEVLKAFKDYDPNQNGETDEKPVIMCSSFWKYFLSAFSIGDDPIVDENNKVMYGYMMEGYKDYLEEMKKWWDEELIYCFFDEVSLEKMDEYVTGNIAGTWKGNASQFDTSRSDSFINRVRKLAPNAEFSAARWPKTADGYQWCYSDINSFDRISTVITKNAVKDGVENAAAYLLDYMLTEQGSTYLTWGIEGESYEVVNGEKKLMDGMEEMVDFHNYKIQALNTYADPMPVRFPQFGQLSNLIMSGKNEKFIEACEEWSIGDNHYKPPAACQLNYDQYVRINETEKEMVAYIAKMREQFVKGIAPLTGYDTYVQQVRNIGGDDYVEVWQEAYDNYLTR